MAPREGPVKPLSMELLPVKRRKVNVEEQQVTSSSNKTGPGMRSESENRSKQFVAFKKHLMLQLYNKLPLDKDITLPYLKETRREIDRIMKQAIIQKESHSVILVGPRQSYKTFLLEHELQILRQKHQNQFITIKLGGFLHTEQTAINSIALQLEHQIRAIHGMSDMSVKKELETDNEDLNEAMGIASGSLTEVFEKILKVLDVTTLKLGEASKESNQKSKITVIFVFDEIDLFAGPVRQTLLYNLFDMVEHARVPVCIFGCTTKLNVLDHLERRVKSRFSQRLIYMPQIANFEEFQDNIKTLLLTNSEHKMLDSEWNSLVKSQFRDANSAISQELSRHYDLYKSIPHFRNTLIPLIAQAKNMESLTCTFKSFEYWQKIRGNTLSQYSAAKILSLSDLELVILISAARVALRGKDSSVNFNLTYAEYKNILKALNTKIPTLSPMKSLDAKGAATTMTLDNAIKLWSKLDVKNVWETLHSLGFFSDRSEVFMHESAASAWYSINYQTQGSMVPFDVRVFYIQTTLLEIRNTIPRSSIYYQWTQL